MGQNLVSAGQRPGATQSRHSLVPKEQSELTPELQLNLRRILYPGVILNKRSPRAVGARFGGLNAFIVRVTTRYNSQGRIRMTGAK